MLRADFNLNAFSAVCLLSVRRNAYFSCTFMLLERLGATINKPYSRYICNSYEMEPPNGRSVMPASALIWLSFSELTGCGRLWPFSMLPSASCWLLTADHKANFMFTVTLPLLCGLGLRYYPFRPYTCCTDVGAKSRRTSAQAHTVLRY